MKKTALTIFAVLLVLVLSACANLVGDTVKDGKLNEGTPLPEATLAATLDAEVTQTVVPMQTEMATTPEAVLKQQTEAPLIARERAVEIALEKAGLTKNDVYDLEAELDKEINGTFWEVDFETKDYEYSYDINAKTGEVVRQEKEINN